MMFMGLSMAVVAWNAGIGSLFSVERVALQESGVFVERLRRQSAARRGRLAIAGRRA